MIAILFLFITFLASFGIVQYVFPAFQLRLQLGAAMVLSVLFGTWLALGLIAWFGYAVGLTAVFLIAGYTALKLRPTVVVGHSLRPPWPLIAFIVSWLLVFGMLFHKTFFLPSILGLDTLPYSYGDLALHSTYINYFAAQENISLTSPIFSQQPITYPFLLDFYTSFLVKMGLTVRWALLFSSFQVVIPLLIMLYSVCYDITKKVVTPVIASLLLFLNGGMGFTKAFEDWKNSGKSLDTFITQLPLDYTNTPHSGYYWSNMITTHLLPQRGFLIGLAFLFLFFSWWQELWEEKKIVPQQLIFISCTVGLLPLFHLHTFLVCLCLMVWFFSHSVYQKSITTARAVLMCLPSVVLGGLQVVFIAGDKQFLKLQLGWLVKEQNILSFWLQNAGVSLVFLVLTPILFLRIFPKRSFEKALLVPTIVIFILCNTFIFQPNPWDNMKFFLLGFAVTSILTAAVLTKYWTNFVTKACVTCIIVAATISGVLSLLYVTQNPNNLATPQDLVIAEAVKKTPADSVFLTSDVHNHPVPMLAGRAVVRGYRGWLWTHGIDFKQTDEDIENIYRGITATDLLRKYSVEYVYIGPSEKRQHQINEEFFKSRYTPIYQDSETTIYKVEDVNLGQLPQL